MKTFITCIIILLFVSISSASDFDKVIMCYNTVSVLDLISTEMLIHTGNIELNPLGQSILSRISMKLIGMTASTWGLYYIYNQSPKAAYVTSMVLIFIYSYVTTNNFKLAIRIK
jgi:hypothetical protein